MDLSSLPWREMSLGLVTSFVSVGLKGFQHKNVIGDHYKLVFVTSYLMSAIDVLLIGLIVKGGLVMAIPAGTGAACGMMTAMWLHRKFVSKPCDQSCTQTNLSR